MRPDKQNTVKRRKPPQGHPNILEASPQQRDADDRKVAAETIIAEIDAALAAGGGADG